MVGTKSFGLSLRDSALIILFFTVFSTVPVAYMCTWGPKTGMRQLVQARFSFGYVPLTLPLARSDIDGNAGSTSSPSSSYSTWQRSLASA